MKHTPTPLNILDMYVANCRECGCDDINISFDSKVVRAVNSHETMKDALNKAYVLLSEFSELASWQDKDNNVLEEIKKLLIENKEF